MSSVLWFCLCVLVGAGSFALGLSFAVRRDNPIYRVAKWLLARSQQWAPTSEPHWKLMTSIFAQASPVSADVAVVGDSLVAHGRWDEWFPGLRIVNRGISGDGVAGVLGRIDEVLAPNDVGKVLLMVGINDLGKGRSSEDIVSDYAKILRRLDGKDTVVHSVPLTTGPSDFNKRVSDLNDRLKALCADSVAAEFLDLNAILAADGQMPSTVSTGWHLNGEGYRLWCLALAERIRTASMPA